MSFPLCSFFLFALVTNYDKNELYSSLPASTLHERQQQQQLGSNNLNINVPENNAVLRLEVELRDKHRRHERGGVGIGGGRGGGAKRGGGTFGDAKRNGQQKDEINNFMVPMEKVRY